MKLRNKNTGENGIINLVVICDDLTYCYETIETLLTEWKDYTSAEPLIKDKKVRKAVRAWAEANDIEDGITYLDYGEFRSYLNTTIDFAILVDEHRFDLLKKSEEYTITELCGEEKE